MGGSKKEHFDQVRKSTVNEYYSIDIHYLKKHGMLDVGSTNSLWGQVDHSTKPIIAVTAKENAVRLCYRLKSTGKQYSYDVAIVKTPCNFGGFREWFLCPKKGCGRRVGILYGGKRFTCRHCKDLAYPSQREQRGVRAYIRAENIMKKLNMPDCDILNWYECEKPKGMHWKTFERLNEEYKRNRQLVMRALVGA